MYGPIFKVIGFFYRTYTANRRRLTEIKSKRGVAAVIQVLAIIFLLGWILIWIFAPEEYRTRLTDEIEKSIGGFGTTID